MILQYVPLLVASLLLVAVGLSAVNRRVDLLVNRLAFRVFDGWEIERDGRRERVLRSAGIGTPYRLYAAKTTLLTAIGAVCGLVFGLYLGTLIVDLLPTALSLPVEGDFLRSLSAWLQTDETRTLLVLGTAGLLAGVGGLGMYLVRWQIPAVRAGTRRRQIDAGMPRMIAFVYALSRGGMPFPEVMRTLSKNRGVFGTAAEEINVGVRNIDLFGDDLVSAIRNLAHRTPSEQFQTFAENLTSVLQSGRDLSAFLQDEYERYREAAEEQQQEILDLLAATAEIYVTVVVAGMLFLITILLVIGLTSGGMLPLIELITYAVLPATNVLFIAYLSEITQPLRATRDEFDTDEDRSDDDRFGGERVATLVGNSTRADGGIAPSSSVHPRTENRRRFDAYERFRSFRTTVTNPARSLLERPTLLLYVTLPVAVGFLLASLPTALSADGLDVARYDDAVIQAALFVLGTFAVVYEIHRRRLERLEESVPDLLERLGSLNEAGVAVVTSFDRVRQSDLGELDAEVDRIWRDIQWGATVEEALERFERRVQTPPVTRVVTLITNAMRASNEIGPVLRIAAKQAHNDRRLKRHRKQEMFTYLVIIYVAFLVFLVVIGAIDYVLIPNLPSTDSITSTGSVISAPGLIAIGNVDTDAYKLVFFHAGVIQATMSGLIGGQMSNGSIKDGFKHAAILLALAYVVSVLLQDVTAASTLAATMGPLP